MKKSKFGLITIFGLFCSSFQALANESDLLNFEYQGLYYEQVDYGSNEVRVAASRVQWTEGDIVIPSEVINDGKTYSVTSVADFAFYTTNITSVEIPNSILSIGHRAFCMCDSLSTVKIPESVTSIGSEAFAYLDMLDSIEIGNSVTTIGDDAFNRCISLSSVDIPASVTTLGANIFRDCVSLTSIVIPSAVTSIGESITVGCTQMTSIVVDPENKVYDSRDNCNAIIETATNTFMTGCPSSTIPNSIEIIGENAFGGSRITSLELPNSVKIIGRYAFVSCDSLSTITFPDSLKGIGYGAFQGCSALKSIEIPESVEEIISSAFQGCSNLTSVKIPASVTHLGGEVFGFCDNLSSLVVDAGNTVYDSRDNCNAIIETATNTLKLGCKSTVIPSSVTSIADYALKYCKTLASIEIPNSVTSIGNEAFYCCDELDSVYIPNSVTTIGVSAFEGCGHLRTVHLPDSITRLENRLLSSCYSLVSVNIPKTVTSIGFLAFGFTSLREIALHEGVTELGASAFYFANSLKSVSLPYSLQKIEGDCFDYCNSLESVTLKNLKALEGITIPIPCSDLAEPKITVQSDSVLRVLDDDFGKRIAFDKFGTATITVEGISYNTLKQVKRVCKYNIAGYPVTIGSTGYATFSAPSDYVVPKGLQAGAVKVTGNQAVVTYKDSLSTEFPSDEAIILKGAPGTYFLNTPYEPTTATKNPENDLLPALTNDTIVAGNGKELFVLAEGAKGLGFYYQMGCPGGSLVHDLAGKAYLELPEEGVVGTNGLRLVENNVTGVEQVAIDRLETEQSAVYTLTGVRLNKTIDQLSRGIYIVNGKKVIIK